MNKTSVLRGLAVTAAAVVLGSWWGRLCDWLWPGLSLAMVAEVTGAIFIGLFLSLRTRRWWKRPSTTEGRCTL